MNARSLFATLTAALALSGAMSATAAQAKIYELGGKGKGDPTVRVELELNASKKRGTLGRALWIRGFQAENVPFQCDKGGPSGRSDYVFIGNAVEPLPISRKGEFSDVYEFETRGYVIERDTLEGKVTAKGKFAVVTGTFKAERSEGGLEFSNCSTPEVPFTAKVRL